MEDPIPTYDPNSWFLRMDTGWSINTLSNFSLAHGDSFSCIFNFSRYEWGVNVLKMKWDLINVCILRICKGLYRFDNVLLSKIWWLPTKNLYNWELHIDINMHQPI